ncbi:hypothetical protein ACFLWV_03905 [Chloroflexota bacterium]
MKKRWRIPAVMISLAVVFLVSTLGMAQAFWVWCWWDPELDIEGHHVNINIALPEDSIDAVVGNITVLVEVPRGVDAEVLAETVLPNGVTTDTHIIACGLPADDEIDVDVKVMVPTRNGKFPLLIEVLVDDELVESKEATTGKPVRLDFEIDVEG